MIVADTNVVLRGMEARMGASNVILQAMVKGELPFAVTPAVVFEYEDVLKRPASLERLGLDRADVDTVLDALCLRAVMVRPFFRFRPFLDDPKDDIFVECALAAGFRVIVTDDRHFRHPALAGFGLVCRTASQFVREWTLEGRRP